MDIERKQMKCSMVNCDNVFTNNGEKYFFGYPRDFDLCMLWVQNSGQPEFFEDFAFGGAQPFIKRYICSDHFVDTDFIDAEDKNLGLLSDAVPNLKLSFEEIQIKQEIIDAEPSTILSTPSEFDLLTVKTEKICNDISEESNSNYALSTNYDSCTDHSKDSASESQTEEENKLSNEFFMSYKRAKRSSNTRYGLLKKFFKETPEERLERLKKDALRAKIKRAQETEEQKNIRKMKNALHIAFRRKNETPEQREERRRKDMVRARRRRQAESEDETRIRRYNDAVRAAFRRNNESEEQKLERQMKDSVRAAKRRSMETPEKRAERLKKDRERAYRKRMLKKILEEMNIFDVLISDSKPVEHCTSFISEPIEEQLLTISSQVAKYSESTNIDILQEALQFFKSHNKRRKKNSHYSLLFDDSCQTLNQLIRLSDNMNKQDEQSIISLEKREEGDEKNNMASNENKKLINATTEIRNHIIQELNSISKCA